MKLLKYADDVVRLLEGYKNVSRVPENMRVKVKSILKTIDALNSLDPYQNRYCVSGIEFSTWKVSEDFNSLLLPLGVRIETALSTSRNLLRYDLTTAGIESEGAKDGDILNPYSLHDTWDQLKSQLFKKSATDRKLLSDLREYISVDDAAKREIVKGYVHDDGAYTSLPLELIISPERKGTDSDEVGESFYRASYYNMEIDEYMRWFLRSWVLKFRNPSNQ